MLDTSGGGGIGPQPGKYRASYGTIRCMECEVGGTTESVMVVSCESSAIDLKPGLSSRFLAQEEKVCGAGRDGPIIYHMLVLFGGKGEVRDVKQEYDSVGGGERGARGGRGGSTEGKGRRKGEH